MRMRKKFFGLAVVQLLTMFKVKTGKLRKYYEKRFQTPRPIYYWIRAILFGKIWKIKKPPDKSMDFQWWWWTRNKKKFQILSIWSLSTTKTFIAINQEDFRSKQTNKNSNLFLSYNKQYNKQKRIENIIIDIDAHWICPNQKKNEN